MEHRWRVGVGGLLILLAVAGCNFSTDDEAEQRKPTLGTPIAWATARTETAAPEMPVVTVPSATNAPTLTPQPTIEAAVMTKSVPLPTLTPIPLPLVPTLFPSLTAAPTLTVTPFQILTVTAAPTITMTAFQIFTATTGPTLTNTPFPVFTPTNAPTQTSPSVVTYVQPPTFTPVVFYTFTPSEIALAGAQVCSTCGQLRLRDAPGTAGSVVALLESGTPLTVIGRTTDTVWVQVVLPDGRNGWVAAQYLTFNIDLNLVGITGAAQDAPTAVAMGPTGIEVVSGITSNARLIFLDGRAKGNLPHVFTKVGDSISASPNFLVSIGSGNYGLGTYSYLGGAISFFSGPNGRGANPFVASSLAARNSWSTESVLNPANADPNVCRTGETPLACEYRLVRPAVALIMFGTNDSGGMPTATFSANLAAIVQTSINMGVIPVLSTIPPKRYSPSTDGRVAEFNQVIVTTARAYDIPLWNYWQAMSSLPGEGLASDGVHPSAPPDGLTAVFDGEHLKYGYPMRNLTALQMLYTLWQQVLYDGDQAPAATAPPAGGEPGGMGTISCPGALLPQLAVGGQGRVTPGLPNKVRGQPGTSAAQIGNIPGEGVFSVIGGPQCADGYLWWQINYDGLIGWTANGTDTEYWVEPYP